MGKEGGKGAPFAFATMYNNQRNLMNGNKQIEVSGNSSENKQIEILLCDQAALENNLEHLKLQEGIISPN
jgi:hypothetical protein